MTDQAPQAPAPAARAKSPMWPDWVRDVLALGSTLIFAGVLFAPAFVKGLVFDGDLKGAAIMQWALVMGFYFGSSRDSSTKTVTAAAQAQTIADMAKGDQ